MATIKIITSIYQDLFNQMQIQPKWIPAVKAAERQAFSKRSTYEAVVSKVNPRMPWYFVACIDAMEGSGTANRHLHNGDSLLRRTVNDPAGRPLADPINGKGTPFTFLESAVDALTMIGYHVQTSWTLELMLYRLEKYNGFGYAKRKLFTPYLWSGTNLYKGGKFTSDGHFDPGAISNQVGAAPLLRYITDRTAGLTDSAK